MSKKIKIEMDEDDITSLTTKMASTNIKFIDQDVDIILYNTTVLTLILKSTQSKIQLNSFRMNNIDILKLNDLINRKISKIDIKCDNEIELDNGELIDVIFHLYFEYIDKNTAKIFFENSVGQLIYDISISNLTMNNILRKIFFHKLNWYKDNIEMLCNNADEYSYSDTLFDIDENHSIFDMNEDAEEDADENVIINKKYDIIQNRLNLIFDKLYQYYKFVPNLEEKCKNYEVKTKKREKQTTKRHADNSDEDD